MEDKNENKYPNKMTPGGVRVPGEESGLQPLPAGLLDLLQPWNSKQALQQLLAHTSAENDANEKILKSGIKRKNNQNEEDESIDEGSTDKDNKSNTNGGNRRKNNNENKKRKKNPSEEPEEDTTDTSGEQDDNDKLKNNVNRRKTNKNGGKEEGGAGVTGWGNSLQEALAAIGAIIRAEAAAAPATTHSNTAQQTQV